MSLHRFRFHRGLTAPVRQGKPHKNRKNSKESNELSGMVRDANGLSAVEALFDLLFLVGYRNA
jgi:hypothetical protein